MTVTELIAALQAVEDGVLLVLRCDSEDIDSDVEHVEIIEKLEWPYVGEDRIRVKYVRLS